MNQSLKSLGQIGRSMCGKELVKELPTVKYVEGSVTMWGTFANCWVGDLHQMKGKLNQTCYHSILQHHAIPSWTRLVSQGFQHMQDDPKHIIKFCQRYIKSKEEQHILRLMSWPAQSTDLHPNELVRYKLDRKFRAKQSTSTTQL